MIEDRTIQFIKQYVPANPACTSTYAQIHTMLEAFKANIGFDIFKEKAEKWIALTDAWYEHQGHEDEETGEYIENEECDLCSLGELAQSHIEGDDF
jgi:hypothetical protein